MTGPYPRESNRRPWHRLVEHYTPDGALGRFLLAVTTGTVGTFAFIFAIFGFTSAGLGPLLVGLAGTGVGLATGLVTILVLWPVYLSLIGNVESAAEYGSGSPSMADSAESSSDDDDSVEILKRRYAAGEVSDDEFERRLDALLDAEGQTDTREAADYRRDDADAVRELDRT